MAVLAIFALLIFGGFVVASYYGIWAGILKPARELWKNETREQRRRSALGMGMITLFVVLVLGLCIAQPFGRFTVGYVFAGVGTFFFIGLHMIVVGEIRKSHRSKRR